MNLDALRQPTPQHKLTIIDGQRLARPPTDFRPAIVRTRHATLAT